MKVSVTCDKTYGHHVTWQWSTSAIWCTEKVQHHFRDLLAQNAYLPSNRMEMSDESRDILQNNDQYSSKVLRYERQQESEELSHSGRDQRDVKTRCSREILVWAWNRKGTLVGEMGKFEWDMQLPSWRCARVNFLVLVIILWSSEGLTLEGC